MFVHLIETIFATLIMLGLVISFPTFFMWLIIIGLALGIKDKMECNRKGSEFNGK
ncbi:MAG: hypothetical protein AB7E42_02290 [Anaerotignaceae bacterium]